jgi:Ca2+-binding RTX toxin-like protein
MPVYNYIVHAGVNAPYMTLGDAFFAGSAPTTRDQHVIYDQASGLLSYDLDGSGARPAIAFAQVTPGTVLDHNDFLTV